MVHHLGKDHIENYGLRTDISGYYANYDLKVDASVLNSYAAAAGLFFFALYGDSIKQYNKDGMEISRTPLSNNFYNPGNLYFQSRLDSYLR